MLNIRSRGNVPILLLVFLFVVTFSAPMVWGCTTILAAGNATVDGSIIIAKNRDLSEYEVQWLYRAPPMRHVPGSTVNLQYIEIPQAEVTYGWVGSKSYDKKWGVGMGINEWGVVVADNDAPTREPLEGDSGLHDNDICRLVLERSRTANDGVQLVGALIEEYGHSYVGQIYWVVDPGEAWIVECAGHHWAAVRVEDGVAVRANQYQITTSWDEGSSDLVEYAVDRGWCDSAEGFSFAECYSREGYPYRSSQTRVERGLDLLGGKIGELTREDLMDVLSDHYEDTNMYRSPHGNEMYRTICGERTVSAMVAQLEPGLPSSMQVMWYCMSSPCVGVFMPVYANVSKIPEPYLTGEGPENPSGYDEMSAWWVFKMLQLSVDEDYAGRQPPVREMWDEVYAAASSEIEEMEGALLTLYGDGDAAEARQLMDDLVEARLVGCYESALETVNGLMDEEPVEPVEEAEDKTLVYIGLAGALILVGGVLINYLMRVEGRS